MAVTRKAPLTGGQRQRIRRAIDSKQRTKLGLKKSQDARKNNGGSKQSFVQRCLAAADGDPLLALDLAVQFDQRGFDLSRVIGT